MATLSEINSFLVKTISTALTTAGVTNGQVGSEWPSTEILQDVGKDCGPVLALIHRHTPYESGNMRFPHSVTSSPAAITSTVSSRSIAAGQTTTITIALAQGATQTKPGDIVSVIWLNGDTYFNTSYTVKSGDTVSAIATGLGAAVQAAQQTVTVAASASGAVLTLTNNGSVGYQVSSNVGITIQTREGILWACRYMQLNAWSGDLATKFKIQQAIEQQFAIWHDQRGFFLLSGEWVEFKFRDAKPDDGDTDKDVYTDLYLFDLKNIVDQKIDKWAITAPSVQVTGPANISDIQ
jgi:hypothetical protein